MQHAGWIDEVDGARTEIVASDRRILSLCAREMVVYGNVAAMSPSAVVVDIVGVCVVFSVNTAYCHCSDVAAAAVVMYRSLVAPPQLH